MNFLTENQIKYIQSPTFYSKIEVFKGHWKVSDCQAFPNTLFIFGDNDIKKGAGGQAIIRNCPNAIGVPTKKYPNNNPDSFYTDTEFEDNLKNIKKAISTIIKLSKDYDIIMFPEDGFGTGLAQLETKAPRTFAALNSLLNKCFYLRYN